MKARPTILFLLAVIPALRSAPSASRVDGKNLRIEFDRLLHSRVVATLSRSETAIGPFVPSESIRVAGADIQDFTFQSQKRETVRDSLGTGRRFILTGEAQSLRKTVVLDVYDEFPRMIFFQVQYTNTGKSDLTVEGWANNQYAFAAGPSKGGVSFWSFQSGSYQNRPLWILPLQPGF